jgi:predicted transcriptional regulator
MVVVAILGLILYGIYVYVSKQKEKDERFGPAAEKERFESMKRNIMKTIYKRTEPNRSPVYKIIVIEELNIQPKMLKRCIDALIREQCVEETEETIELTDFGATFVEVFILQKER